MRSTKQIDNYLSPSFCFDCVRPFLLGTDLIKFLTLSATFSKYFIAKAELSLQIPWADYKIPGAPENPKIKYYGVRDYYIFTHLKELVLSIPHSFPYPPCSPLEDEHVKKDKRILLARTILAQTHCSNVLRQKKRLTKTLDRKREKKEWEQFVTAAKEENKKDFASHVANLETRTKLSLTSPEMAATINRLKDKTAIVMTFYGSCLAPHDTLLNFFEHEQGIREDYFDSRLVSEFITLCPHSSISDLLSLILVPALHVNYANLQYIDKLIPTKLFGEDFFVLNEAAKEFSVAHYRDMFDICFSHRKSNERIYSVSLAQSPIALLAQLSDEVLTSFLKGDESDVIPKAKWNYFEVQFSTKNPFEYIRHLHLSLPSLIYFIQFIPQIAQSKNGQLVAAKNHPLIDDERITLSVGKNPFENSEFSTAFIEKKEDQLIKNQIVKNLEAVFRCLGEITDPKCLTCNYTADALEWEFHITKNSDRFHQAPAAHIFYLLGAVNYFSKNSPIKFTDYPDITHRTPLNGIAKNEGGLADHFALRNTKNSLNWLLKRALRYLLGLFVIIPKQNEEYFLTHKVPHPRTGKGATEEEYLTKELYLGRDEKESFDINVEWFYDRVVFKVVGSDSNFLWVLNHFCSIFGRKKIGNAGYFIYIDLTVLELVTFLTKKRISYHATDIFNAHGEIILFPMTKNKGLGSTGGKFHDGDRVYLAGRDFEFGKPLAGIDIAKIREETGFIATPSTICFSVRDFFIKKFEVDQYEFVEHKKSYKNPPAYSLARANALEDHQIAKLADSYGMSVAEYKKNFDRGLALSPEHTGSIWVNIRRWQQLISQELRTQLKATFNVRINDNYDIVWVNSNKYRLLSPDFCQIKITCEWLPDLRKVQDYLSTKKIVSTRPPWCELVLAPIEPRWALTLMGVYREGKYALDYFRENPEFLDNPTKALHFIHEVYQAFPAEEVAFLCLEILKQKQGRDVINRILAEGFPSRFVIEVNNFLDLPNDPQITNKYIQNWLHTYATLIREPIQIFPQICRALEVDSTVDIQAIQNFLHDPTTRDSLLHLAVEYDRLDVVKFLLEKKADVDARSADCRSVLHLALDNGLMKIAEVLVTHMMKQADEQKIPEKSNSMELNALLESEAKLEVRNLSILHLIFINDRLPTHQIAFLINKYKYAIGIKDDAGWTLFHLLCSDYCDYVPEITFLPFSINPNLLEIIDNNGNTPLHVALKNPSEISKNEIASYSRNRINIVNKLIEIKANVNTANEILDTPLHLLINNTSIDFHTKIKLASALIKAGAKIDSKNINGETPLSLAKKLRNNNPLSLARKLVIAKLIAVLTGQPEVVQSTHSATLFASKEKESVREGPSLSL